MRKRGSSKSGAFIYGYYGFGNLGDDLLLATLVDQLTSRRFAETLYIRNMGGIELLRPSPAVELTNLELPLIASRGARPLRKLAALLKYFNQHIEIFKRCHSFVLGGGTLISQSMSRKTLFVLTMLVFLARRRRLRVVALGLGITRITGFSRRILAQLILRMCSKIYVRDEASLSAGKDVWTSANLTLTSDLVFSSNSIRLPTSTQVKRPEVVTIGFTLVEPFLRGRTEGVDTHSVILAVAECISLCLRNGFRVKLIGFQSIRFIGGATSSDVNIFKEMISKYRIEGVEVVDASNSSGSLGEFYDDLNVVIGMRYHSLVLSALSLKPFVGFSCDHKISSLCNSFDMPYIDILEINGSALFGALIDALHKEVDVRRLHEFRVRSALNFSGACCPA